MYVCGGVCVIVCLVYVCGGVCVLVCLVFMCIYIYMYMGGKGGGRVCLHCLSLCMYVRTCVCLGDREEAYQKVSLVCCSFARALALTVLQVHLHGFK